MGNEVLKADDLTYGTVSRTGSFGRGSDGGPIILERLVVGEAVWKRCDESLRGDRRNSVCRRDIQKCRICSTGLERKKALSGPDG
ncbi:MAG: hypothetical protein ABIK08_05070, partial [Pseudomonadota bacterium]